MRIILLVDLDAFFPSVEVREHHELKYKTLFEGNIESIHDLASTKPKTLARLFGTWPLAA